MGSDDTREHATSLLNELNTNICEISIRKIDLKQFIDQYDEYGEDGVLDLLKAISDEYYLCKKDKPESAGVSVTLCDDDFYKVGMYHDDQFEVETIEIKECDNNQVYRYCDLSRSTLQIMNLLDIIFSQTSYGVYVIDEPLLTLSPVITIKEFLEKYQNQELKNLSEDNLSLWTDPSEYHNQQEIDAQIEWLGDFLSHLTGNGKLSLTEHTVFLSVIDGYREYGKNLYFSYGSSGVLVMVIDVIATHEKFEIKVFSEMNGGVVNQDSLGHAPAVFKTDSFLGLYQWLNEPFSIDEIASYQNQK